MKISGLEIFVDFFFPMLEMLVSIISAGVGEGEVAATPIKMSMGDSDGAAAAASIGELIDNGSEIAAPIVIVMVGFPLVEIDLHV